MVYAVGGALLGACVLFCLLLLWTYGHNRSGIASHRTAIVNGRRVLASGILAPVAARDTEPTSPYPPPPETMRDDDRTVYPCIHCARCLDVCPVALNPCMLALLSRKGRYAEMNDAYGLRVCINCGNCADVCPSNIPMLQLYRAAREAIEKGAPQHDH